MPTTMPWKYTIKTFHPLQVQMTFYDNHNALNEDVPPDASSGDPSTFCDDSACDGTDTGSECEEHASISAIPVEEHTRIVQKAAAVMILKLRETYLLPQTVTENLMKDVDQCFH